MISENKMKHSLQVARNMYELAKKAGLEESLCRQYFAVGILHDIGYEWDDNSKHPDSGADVLKDIGCSGEVVHAVREHGNPDAERTDLLDALNSSDMTSDFRGNKVGMDRRLDDIGSRYGKNSKQYLRSKRIVEKLSGRHTDVSGTEGPMEGMRLVVPDGSYSEGIEDFRKEFLEYGERKIPGGGCLRTCGNVENWFESITLLKNPDTVPDGYVASTQFLYVRNSDEKIVGIVQVRHYLNDYLEKYAGHVGGSIRPSERRKGYSTAMLSDAVRYCGEIGITDVLVTCSDGNEGSRRTIIRCGGVFESRICEPGENEYTERYWIHVHG